MVFSFNPEVSDSTIKTASFVPATTKSSSEFFNSLVVGFNKNFLSLYPTLLAAIGPLNGRPDIARAAEEAIIERTSGWFSPSYDKTVGKTCTSFIKLEGNNGLIGLSINLDIKVSASVGLASLLK